MFDWPAAVDLLHRISKEQVVRFLAGPDKDDVYGAGLFCDAYDGSVYLVANTEQYHRTSLRDFEARFGETDPEVFRWDIGNWKYPGGLFPSSSAAQQAFDTAWGEYRQALSEIESDHKQGILEDACAEVVKRLFKEGTFSTAPFLKGFTVLGPDAGQEDVLEKKKRLDSLLQPDMERHQQ
jgi:Domain of unknown function (DUF4303)